MLLELDLAGGEWFVTGFLAPEPAMIAVFNSGESPHAVTGARMSGLDKKLVEIESKALGYIGDPDHIAELRREKCPEVLKARWLPRSMSIRQAAKKANHGCNYRLGFRTFALNNEMPENEAKKIIELYRGSAYPGLNAWYERIDKTLRDTRTLTNCFGRRVYFSGALNDETFRQATAFVPQSTVFDVTAQAMPKLLDDETPDFAPSQLLAQVHDSLLTQFRSRDFNAMARYAIKLGLDYLSPTLRYNEMDFVLGVGLKVGASWGSLQEIKLTRDADALALELRRVYEEQSEKRAAA